jgi:L-ribulose-5-phosphate 3-epimerase
MPYPLSRRVFLMSSAALGAGLTMAGPASGSKAKGKLLKALIGTPDEKTFVQAQAAGFDGMESTAWKVPPETAEACRKLAERHGQKIHSVLFGWANFNQENKVDRDVADVTLALETARAYGAAAVLLVPCRLGGMAMPKPWQFDLEFDKKTNHLKRVVRGGNAPFEKYIQAHNQAADASRSALLRLIPAAEKNRVVIALENVWNNLWVEPAFFANFVASLNSPWIRAYFDIGNAVVYAPPEKWIQVLGKLIVKCHVKDFKLDPDVHGQKKDLKQNPDGHGGEFVEIRQGSVNWPRVRAELDAVGYQGWLTIESSRLPLREQSKRLDQIIAGK